MGLPQLSFDSPPLALGAHTRANPGALFELFPEVYQVSLRVEAGALHEEALLTLYPPIPAELWQAVSKRKLEYWLGRWCAERALLAAGHSGRTWLQFAKHGPEWPTEFVGSLTHTHSFVSAAVARAEFVAGIGIDSEPVVASDAFRSLCSAVFSEAELGVCKAEAERSRTSVQALATVGFSAKESLFKATYRRVGFVFGFEEARLRRLDVARGTFELIISGGLGPTLPAGTVVRGSHAIEADCVHTAVVLRNHSRRACR